MIVSYAQNFEDVMLWRALGSVEDGFFIDVGAQDPVLHSVSLAFHERGWGGVSIEASPFYAEALRHARPGSWIIEAALAGSPGRAFFNEITGTGLSTLQDDLAEKHRDAGFSSRSTEVICRTLDGIFHDVQAIRGDRPVHWLKVDVEGAEGEVLRGWRTSDVRPWIVVVEAIVPINDMAGARPEETHAEWEPLLLDRDYAFAHFDGLNRFYVSTEHPELMTSFEAAPNIFDRYSLPITSDFVPDLRDQILRQDRLIASQAHANATLSRLLADALRVPDGSQDVPSWQSHLASLQRSLEAIEVENNYLRERLVASLPPHARGETSTKYESQSIKKDRDAPAASMMTILPTNHTETSAGSERIPDL